MMTPRENWENDERCLERLTALGSQHPDVDFRLMARVVTRLLAERVCELTEAAFRAGMARGEYSDGPPGTSSRKGVHEFVGQESPEPAASVVAATGA